MKLNWVINNFINEYILDDEEELLRSLSLLPKNKSQIFENGKCNGIAFNGVNGAGSSGTSAESEGTTETSSNDENEK